MYAENDRVIITTKVIIFIGFLKIKIDDKNPSPLTKQRTDIIFTGGKDFPFIVRERNNVQTTM